MKKLMNYIGILLLVWAACGCTDEQIAGNAGAELRVTGKIDTPSSSRTSYAVGEDAVTVSWAAGDRIGLFSESQPAAMAYQAASAGKQVDFMPETTRLKPEDGTEVYAFYPYNYYTDITYPHAPLPDLFSQNYSGGLPDPDMDFMYAKGEIKDGMLNLDFAHSFAFLKVNIRTELLEDAAGLLVRSEEPISFSGLDYERPYYDVEGDSLVAITYDHLWYYIPQDILAAQEVVTCCIAVLPTSEKNTVSFFINANNGSIDRGLIERKAPEGGFQAGHVYDLSVDENEFDKILQQEREALIAFYEATGGDNWTDNTNWCSDKPLSEWYGVYMWDGRVKNIILTDNNLTGQIPEQFGDLTGLEYLYLSSNKLEGNIPESLGNLAYLHDVQLNNNNLSGNLPASMANLNELEFINLCGNKLNGTIPDEIIASDWWNRIGYDAIVYQQGGNKLTFPMYESSDYSMDGTTFTLQEHTAGKGLKVVILGEAYSDRLIADGTYRRDAEMAMEAFFSKEPYTSFRDYFDVYAVNVVSRNEVIGENTAFQTSYEFERNTFETDPTIAIDYIGKMQETNYSAAYVTSMILMKTKAPFRSNNWSYSDGFSAAFCQNNSDDPESLKSLIHHEACGHGFGKLDDEYVEFEGTYPYPEAIRSLHTINESMNVDVTNDPNEIVWSYFLTDMRYEKEKIGIYEGAIYYPKGAYRATETSIMLGNTGRFNAPSRQSIYRRIMEKSGGVYSFEAFLEYDEINRRQIEIEGASRAGAVEKGTIGLPPVRFDYPSSEAKTRWKQKKGVNVPLR